MYSVSYCQMINLEILKSNINFFNTEKSDKESIELVDKKYNIKLPEVLIEFLILVGNNYDEIFDGIGACKLSKVDYNIDLAKKLLSERNLNFNSKYFPFASYSGDQFLFVYLDAEENPPVYKFETELFRCGDDYIKGASSWGYPMGVSKVADSFSEMINEIVQYRTKASKN